MLEEVKRKEVDKRDKQLPQSFEQLIQMYDLEKLWTYIGNIINYTNNDLPKELKSLQDELEDKIEKGDVKAKDFSISVTPSTSRGSTGYGTTNVDISSINATEIIGVVFHGSSNHMVWGLSSDIKNNPSSLEVYGYRISGTYSNTVGATMRVLYK